MGKGMKAGRAPRLEKDLKKISRFVRQYEAEERKRLVDLARSDLEKDIEQTLSYHHNIDMIALMFALRDEFSFGRSRLIRAVRRTAEHAERMILDKADVDEMLQLLKDETGICEEDLTWDEEIESEKKVDKRHGHDSV